MMYIAHAGTRDITFKFHVRFLSTVFISIVKFDPLKTEN